jgi:hypothetical protein
LNGADVLLHPIRLRIWQAFLGDRALTTAQLREELPEIPPASLYRHVNLLVEHGVLSVAAESKVRGATERTYVLRTAASTITDQELEQMTHEQHRAAFGAYMAGLLTHFDRYLTTTPEIDYRRDGVGYTVAGLWLDDAEFAQLARDLVKVLQPRLANAPKPGRKRRILGTVVIPGAEAPKSAGDEP